MVNGLSVYGLRFVSLWFVVCQVYYFLVSAGGMLFCLAVSVFLCGSLAQEVRYLAYFFMITKWCTVTENNTNQFAVALSQNNLASQQEQATSELNKICEKIFEVKSSLLLLHLKNI